MRGRALCASLVLVVLCWTPATGVHVTLSRDANRVAQDVTVVTIPLAANTDEHRRTQLLMSLKQRWEQVFPSSMLEEGSRALASSSKEIPLDVEILSNKHLATYYGVIEMEGTKFKVLFDTGSCEFWVPSAVCNTQRCQKHSRMPRGRRKVASKGGMNIQYLSGKVQGDMVYETVVLGDVKVKNQVVGLAEVVDIELLDDVKWDGILGLAYPNPALSNKGITPIFDTIIKSGVLTSRHLSNQFAYYIDDRKGAVTFGGADCDLIKTGSKDACINKFKFVPVTEQTYWTITIKDVRIKYPGQPEKSGFCPAGGCKAIVDTGTYLIYGPENQVTSMVTSQLKSCAHHRQMPTFTFDFHVNEGDDPVSVTLDPIDYILKFDLNDKQDCVVGISPDKDVIWTLGQVFLRSFYTVFDRDENRVGFARLPRSNFQALNSRATMKAIKKVQKKEKRAAQRSASLLQTTAQTKVSHHMLNRLRRSAPQEVRDNAHSQRGETAGQFDRGHNRDNRIEETAAEQATDPEKRKEDVHAVMDGLRHIHYDRV